MADPQDKQALQAAALEEIKDALYEPRTTLPRARRRIALILKSLREALGEKPEPEIISTREKLSLFDSARKTRRRR
jgi:hypothetical protein